MYNSVFFDLSNGAQNEKFRTSVLSVYKITTDANYYNCLDDEEKLSRGRDVIAFIRCTKGSMRICTLNREYTIKENDFVFLYVKNIKRYYSTSPLLEFLWINFRAEEYEKFFMRQKEYTVTYTPAEEQKLNKLLSAGKNKSVNKEYINHLFNSYLYLLLVEEDAGLSEAEGSCKRSDEICAYLDQRIYSKVSVEETAEFFNITPRYMHKIFMNELNMSPKQYIMKKKMKEAYRLVCNTTLSVTEISGILCFYSPSHFTRVFSEYYDISPSELRKKIKKR